MKLLYRYEKVAKCAAHYTGHPLAFLVATAIVIIWAICGPIFKFSDTWQLIINTGTTIVTFLMVFLIQSTQNTDTIAMQVKLDELIRATKDAQNILLDLEELDESTLEDFKKKYLALAKQARESKQNDSFQNDSFASSDS